jgi:hypothetical protein
MSSMIGAMGSRTPSSRNISGTGYKQLNLPADPRIQQLFEMLMSGMEPGLKGGLDFTSKLAQGGDENMWQTLEAPAHREFQQNQSQLASRFSGMGMGGRRSSGFNNASSEMNTDLAERLQANRIGLQRSAVHDLLGMSQSLLGTNLGDSMLIPKKKPWWQDLLGGASGGVGSGLGQFGALGLGKWAGLLG